MGPFAPERARASRRGGRRGHGAVTESARVCRYDPISTGMQTATRPAVSFLTPGLESVFYIQHSVETCIDYTLYIVSKSVLDPIGAPLYCARGRRAASTGDTLKSVVPSIVPSIVVADIAAVHCVRASYARGAPPCHGASHGEALSLNRIDPGNAMPRIQATITSRLLGV